MSATSNRPVPIDVHRVFIYDLELAVARLFNADKDKQKVGGVIAEYQADGAVTLTVSPDYYKQADLRAGVLR